MSETNEVVAGRTGVLGVDRFGYGGGTGVQMPEGRCKTCDLELFGTETHVGPDGEFYCTEHWHPLYDEWVSRVYDRYNNDEVSVKY